MCELVTDMQCRVEQVEYNKSPPTASDTEQSHLDCGAGRGGGWMEEWMSRKEITEQNGIEVVPLMVSVGKHELFGELERERSASGHK